MDSHTVLSALVSSNSRLKSPYFWGISCIKNTPYVAITHPLARKPIWPQVILMQLTKDSFATKFVQHDMIFEIQTNVNLGISADLASRRSCYLLQI